MTVEKYDLSRLYVNIEHEEGTSFVQSRTELSSFSEFVEAGDNISKIAILSGDIDSPFTRIKERETMIRSIFEFLKIEDEILLYNIVMYKSELYVSAWVKYLFLLNEIEFTDWMLAKKDYEYFLAKSTKGQEEGESDDKYLKKRNEYRKTISELGKVVKDLEAKIFPDSKAAREAALELAKKKVKLYAEAYAQPFNFF